MILYLIALTGVQDGRGGKLANACTGEALKQDHITFNVAFISASITVMEIPLEMLV